MFRCYSDKTNIGYLKNITIIMIITKPRGPVRSDCHNRENFCCNLPFGIKNQKIFVRYNRDRYDRVWVQFSVLNFKFNARANRLLCRIDDDAIYEPLLLRQGSTWRRRKFPKTSHIAASSFFCTLNRMEEKREKLTAVLFISLLDCCCCCCCCCCCTVMHHKQKY